MLTPTGRVILGMVRLGRRTGYDIKQLVDVSTRFFWAASYGQIYPELRRLEDDGLLTGEDASTNGRQRRAFDLTDAGAAALDEWLRSDDPGAYEYRDEGMLKIFFWDGLGLEERRRILHRMRARHEEVIRHLESIEPRVSLRGGGPYAALRSGLALHRFSAGWLDELERELDTEEVA
jgi:DNA-binding PadR family transcriptional regulator